MSSRDRGLGLRKLVAIATMAARHRASDRGELFARAVFYGLLVFVFSRLWTVIAGADVGPSVAREPMIWYIAVTEWIVLSQARIHTDIQDELRSGDLLYRLTRPVSYPAAKLAEAVGDLVVRMAWLGMVGFGFAWGLTGSTPDRAVLLTLIPLGFVAGVVMVCFELVIGLAAIWLHDCRPVYWVWQKCLFLFGGLLIPLAFYPPWLREVSEATPFAAMLSGPATLVLPGGGAPVGSLVALGGWFVVALGLVALTYRACLRHIDGAGG